MDKFSVVFWILFGVYSLIHIIICYFEKETLRKITKCFILPLLIMYIAVEHCDKPFVYLAAIFGFLGDLLLIFKKKKIAFMVGAASFALGHIFYILQMYTEYAHFEYWHLIIFGLIILLLLIIGEQLFRQKMKDWTPVGVCYFSFLLSCLFVAGLTREKLIIIGVFIFVVSDTIITIVNFINTGIKRKEVYVMSTYILAQAILLFALN